MNDKPKSPQIQEPADWVMISLSWIIYLTGLFYFSEIDNAWLLIALGTLPVLVTAWSLGMSFGIGSAVFSIVIHLLVHIVHPLYQQAINLFMLEHLIGFSISAVMGMFVGHLHDLQVKSRSELFSLVENNQKLIKLSRGLEATNHLTTDLITTQEWLDKIPELLRKIGAAAAIDHLFLLQVTGNGTVNYAGKIHHYWYEIQSHYPTDNSLEIPRALLPWIESAQNDIPVSGTLDNLPEEIIEYLAFKIVGEYAVFPIFINSSLWGFIGFESYQAEEEWVLHELNTFRSIAQTLGSIIHKKLIEDHLVLRAKELDSLEKASSNISSSDHLETGLQTVLSQIYELTPAWDTNIYLYKHTNLHFYISLGKNNQQTLPFSHPGEKEISQLVAESNQDRYIPDVSQFKGISLENNGLEGAMISFSLKAASEVIGVMNIWYSKPRTFTKEEKTILRLLADQATSAIINIRFLQVEREQRILADSLRKANLQLSDNLELKGVLESILNQVLLLVSARDAQIFLYDGKNLDFGAVMYGKDVPPSAVNPPDREGLFYKAAQEGIRILVPDIQAEDKLRGNWKIGSLVILPLIFHRKVIGIMNISFTEIGPCNENLLQILDLLSNQASIAINNARTFEAERSQRKLAQALQHTGRAIQSSLDLEVVLDQILTQIATVIQYHSANLILVEHGEARIVRQRNYHDQQSQKTSYPISDFDFSRFVTLEKMIRTKVPLIISDTEQNPDWIITETTSDVLSWAGAPILDSDKVIGFLSINSHLRNFFTQDHAEILSAFAGQASIALTHASLHKEIQDMAITDPLTGIFNRRGLERWGQYEIDRAKRFNSPLSAIFFDLDHFKEVNDTFGHDSGDLVLKEVVNCCQSVIRKIDIFSRVGGEEFLIILPETSILIAIQIANRLRKIIESHNFLNGSKTIKITISLGVVELDDQINLLSDLMNKADQYMYQAKQSGRNQTAFPVE